MGYSPDVYDEAKIKLEKRRISNEQDLEKRRKFIFSRSPRAEQIEHLIARTSVATAKIIFGGGNVKEELEKLKQHNLALQKELYDIIEELGFPKNYLDMWYQCDKCKDYGYVDGKMCDCMKILMRKIAYDKLNKISPLALSDFDTFSLEYYSNVPSERGKISDYTHMSKVLGFCKKYALEFSQNSRSLLFQGGSGLGKTHLSLAIAKEAINKGFGVIYVSAPTILQKIENEHFSHRDIENSTEQTLTECDLLILDDLGTEFTTTFTVSAIYNIINSRMITSKPTIISTNLSVSELDNKYNARTVSRIIGTLTRVEFVGTDVRQQKRRERTQIKK